MACKMLSEALFGMVDESARRFQETDMVENSMMPSRTGVLTFVDKGERRSGIDRRTFSYTCYIPERRMGADRRSGPDRRRNKRFGIIPEIEASQGAGLPVPAVPRNSATS